MDWLDTMEDQATEEAVLQISGAGHWFLEGLIGDHLADFLVDSGSAAAVMKFLSGSIKRWSTGGCATANVQEISRH